MGKSLNYRTVEVFFRNVWAVLPIISAEHQVWIKLGIFLNICVPHPFPIICVFIFPFPIIYSITGHQWQYQWIPTGLWNISYDRHMKTANVLCFIFFCFSPKRGWQTWNPLDLRMQYPQYDEQSRSARGYWKARPNAQGSDLFCSKD